MPPNSQQGVCYYSVLVFLMILVWNVRGAVGKEFSLTLKAMKKNIKPKIVVLLETRCSGSVAQKAIKKWGFRHQILEEARGMSGGIWILWDEESFKIDVINQQEQFIHCLISGLGCRPWLFTAIYASPRENERKMLWTELEALSKNSPLPWMLAGDFDDIQDASEQRGGTMVNEQKCSRFLDSINGCGLKDLGSEGPKFTWRGPLMRGSSRLFKRLDRGLCNSEWRQEFGEATVRVGARINSDHHQLHIFLQPRGTTLKNWPFRFEAAWLQHQDFKQLVCTHWNEENMTWRELEKFQPLLQEWNSSIFGHIAK